MYTSRTTRLKKESLSEPTVDARLERQSHASRRAPILHRGLDAAREAAPPPRDQPANLQAPLHSDVAAARRRRVWRELSPGTAWEGNAPPTRFGWRWPSDDADNLQQAPQILGSHLNVCCFGAGTASGVAERASCWLRVGGGHFLLFRDRQTSDRRRGAVTASAFAW